MNDPDDKQLLQDVTAGDEKAFERIYVQYHQRARLVAWRMSHRPDWVDDLLNEAWCRAFDHRRTYNPDRPFLVWFAGILRNVYRESCRRSAQTAAEGERQAQKERIDPQSPETIVHEAELLAALNRCLEALDPLDARIIRLRFFEGKTLKAVAQEVSIPESTLRETKLPAMLRGLRRRLNEKKIPISEIFSALGPGESQYEGGD